MKPHNPARHRPPWWYDDPVAPEETADAAEESADPADAAEEAAADPADAAEDVTSEADAG